ncbi:hypothetical protein BDQ94DRAFT_143755 [Aspergillus welwitschiae]|uniref:Uncharacterized protein n=1 Tax=Aspergillus welwitschiae TaxID=1341132 RepID=A0A3F3Q1V1_9EURO|nr:hypothetical protein BDQ94DRAFT_143755 [Aspergillus welwitschiae]RDH33183.1 hypothetical protein BDQ94DRAFT_143755 [Aspergillus welwitschiae]
MLGTYQWTLGSHSGLSGQRSPGKEYGIIMIVQEAMNMRCRLGVEYNGKSNESCNPPKKENIGPRTSFPPNGRSVQ